MPEHSLKPSPCPACGRVNDAASSVEPGHQAPPLAGDLCICFNCGTFLEYDEQLRMRMISLEEFEALPTTIKTVLEFLKKKILNL